jgi:hypothetical protein
MRHLLIVLALLLAGCQSGPGVDDCDTCEGSAIAQPGGPGSSAAAANAAGGQRVGQDPRATDTARISPNTVIGRGAGPTTSDVNSAEGRVVTSGPGITMALQAGTEALAHSRAAEGGAISQSVLQYRADIQALQKDAQILLASGNTEGYLAVLDRISRMQSELVAAERGTAAQIRNYYFQQGQRVVFSNVSGTAGGNPTAPPVSEEGAKAAANALGPVGAATMNSPDAKPVGPQTVPEANATSADDVPPAGFPPPAPPIPEDK